MGEFSHELDVARSIAREAGEALVGYFGSSTLGVREKAQLDVVTLADTDSERRIVSALTSAFPEDAIVGEEGTNTLPGVRRCWYVDPLDGTFNFARTIPYWCVSIGLVVDSSARLGVVFDPLRDEMFWSESEEGHAFLNGNPVGPSNVTELIDALVQVNIDFDRAVMQTSLVDTVAVGREVMRVRNLGSLALQLVYVACGRLDGLVQRRANAWDYAAGALVLQESGAVVSRVDGSRFDMNGPDAVAASTVELHRSLTALLSNR
jgi:myo-inositol-1(or 4)-monophosphatase